VIDAVREGVAQVAADETNRVLIVAGETDRSMIGGADIKEMATLDQASAERFITGLGDLCETIRLVPIPVIARIPGWCLGGGLEVAAACDFRIATEDARFAMPEVRVGIPSVIHAALLPRLIGWSRTRWLLMTGDTIDAPTALGWGLIDKIAPPGGLDDAIEALVGSLLAGAPQALRAQKALLTAWHDMPLGESVAHSIKVFGQSYLTGEPQKLMGAFLARKR
jgi:enoyl-CoA hydratase/carnithine racemase